MKDKKMLIKKIKKGITIAAITTLIVVNLTPCGFMKQSYSSQEDIAQIAKTLDCDTGYLKKENGDFLRMKHNNGEPIYVCFDEKYSEELKAQAKESLDYIFGIVGKINENYHYKIVDKDEFDLKFNKTKIFYTFGKFVATSSDLPSAANGHLESYTSWYNFATDNPVMNYYELNINEEKLNEIESISYTLNHELLHAFGLDDVYTVEKLRKTTKSYGNTYMNNQIGVDMITPNDLACLISLYANDDCNIEQMKHCFEKYETKFYKHYAELCKEKLGTSEDFSEGEFEFVTSVIFEDLNNYRYGYEYRVTVEDDRYLFEIYDYFTKELLDSCKGDVTTQNGVMVLKDVELKVGLKPYDKLESYEGGFVQNLTFVMKGGKVFMYNYHKNDALRGIMDVYEKSLTTS